MSIPLEEISFVVVASPNDSGGIDPSVEFKRVVEYTYNSQFTTPTDGWSFSLAGDDVSEATLNTLIPGRRIRLLIDGDIQASGFIDKVDLRLDRNGGKVLQVQGRDSLAPVVDGCIDPYDYAFSPKSTLDDVMKQIYGGVFGFKTITTSDAANRNIITGNDPANTSKAYETVIISAKEEKTKDGKTNTVLMAKPVTKSVVTETDKTRPIFLKDFQVNSCKPHPGESWYQFTAKLAKRFGLWIWADAIGDTIICSRPDYTQQPTFRLSLRNNTSIIDYQLSLDMSHQTNLLVMEGFGGNGDFRKSKFNVAAVNEFNGYNPDGSYTDAVKKELAKYPAISVLPPRTELFRYQARFRNSQHRPSYIVDDESKNQKQLAFSARHKLSLLQADAFSVTFKVKGHSQDGQPWAVNTIVEVEDPISGMFEQLWISERTFTKSRTGGTVTTIKALPLYALDFNI
jgi:prophage tail gpP-like protein